MELSGKRVLVTGASSGLGRAFALVLLARGAEVWGTSRNPERVEPVEGLNMLRLDLSDPETIEDQWRESGLGDIGIDILVNNAGAGVMAPFVTTEFADWEAQLELMLLAPLKLCSLALPELKRKKGSVLVNVSSLAVEYPIPFMSGYNAAKAGLSSFSESLLLEDCGVRVIDFRPGDFRTPFNENAKIGSGKGSFERACQVMGERLRAAPEPAYAAKRLAKALERGESGTVRTGSFFQRVVASWFIRISSGTMQRRVNRAYYKVGRDEA